MTKDEAGYATDGPFLCGRCMYYFDRKKEVSTCTYPVEGEICFEDCCNEFKSMDGKGLLNYRKKKDAGNKH